MNTYDFSKAVLELKSAFDVLEQKNIKISSLTHPKVYNFQQNMEDCLRKKFLNALEKVKTCSKELHKSEEYNNTNKDSDSGTLIAIIEVIEQLNIAEGIAEKIQKLAELTSCLKIEKQEQNSISPKKLPLDIRDSVLADFSEAEKCFNSGCYRSAVILCGRILEIALHRKYYEATGMDSLEKSPGIGLGSLVAKIKEKNINIDPAIMQQVHLVNQVRVFSVHQRAEAFIPTKIQTKAIMLYTYDLVDRLFV